ncbi:hypothetical protein LPJ64_003268 [Coemansia asiatica]|uniref:Uncharacterized protein n=1 Tax=Coemansia asiatica TaxID=1052880 RepID=A0A9W7XK24_9FUNG|nr:hypothetical protein LPJ64_003268 [Coemansia asiatica]
MARNRNSSSSKKSRSKRSSRSASVSISPASTPATAATPTETPVSETVEETTEPQINEGGEKSERNAQDQSVLEPSSQNDADTDAKDAAIEEAQEVSEEPAAENNEEKDAEKTEDNKYIVDISDLAAQREATEDLLDDLISFSEPAVEPESATKNHTPEEDEEEEEATPTAVAAIANSVNMEDSQAELLASNLDDSMYRSAMNDSTIDELHVLESSQDMGTSEIHENDILDSIRSIESTDRKYVVTPSAFVADKNAEEINSRPESAANDINDISADEAASAAAEVQASKQQIEASADTGSAELDKQQIETVAEEATASSDAAAKIIAEPIDQSMAESYVHVGEESGLLDKSDSAIVPEKHISSVENDNTVSQDMTKREGSEQVERAANKASDAANDAGKKTSRAISDAEDIVEDGANGLSKKANRAAFDAKDAAKSASNDLSKKARDAADSTADAANDAASKARDVFDNASKSMRDAASNVNDKAHDAMSKARESGEKLAKKARQEAEEAEKAVKKQAKETPPATLRALGIVAAALAVVSGYYFRLPGRENQRLGFSSGVASAVIGLGTLATAFIKRNA